MAKRHKLDATDDGDLPQNIDPFIHHVQEALEHFSEPRWIGENSPLATPYFLGVHLDHYPDGSTAIGRGQLLQQLLLEGANTLTGNSEEWLDKLQRQREQAGRVSQSHNLYRDALKERLQTSADSSQLVLFWSYFDPKEPKLIPELSNISRSTLFRWRAEGKIDKAVKDIGSWLIEELRPALRLESPPTIIAITEEEQQKQQQEAPKQHQQKYVVLVRREREVRQGMNVLRQGQTLAITGPGGVGKTTLAATLAARIAPEATFWFTIRSGVNDNMSTLLYELAYFLAQHGSVNLWRQLATHRGAIQTSMAGVLRYDLASLKYPVLLCFDDLDLLQSEAHGDILLLIDSLRGHVAQLLIGHQSAININPVNIFMLEALSLMDIPAFLARAGIVLAPEQLVILHDYTGGNPRLLELFISLYHAGEHMDQVLQLMAQSVSLQNLLSRIMQRLSDSERQVIRALAVYRNPAPEDIWNAAILRVLRERRLVQHDGTGGISVVPAFRPIIYAQIEHDERQLWHRIAAKVREERAAYTAAMYHYLKADLLEAALWTWHPHQLQEIQQGRGATALALLQLLPVDRLSSDDQRDLAQAIDVLKLLSGQLNDPPKDRGDSGGLSDDIRNVFDDRTWGDIHELQSRLDRARDDYHAGLRTVERLLQETAIFHKNLSWVAMRQRELGESWKEACRARYEAVNMQGYVQEELGKHALAHTYYLEALALTQQGQFSYPQGEAKTYNNLTRLTGKMHQFDDSFHYGALAARLYRQIGDLAMMSSVQVNLALAYNLARRPADAIPPAKEALAFFTQSEQAWGITAAAQNLAEAYLALVLAAADGKRIGIDTQSLADAYLTLIRLAAAPRIIIQPQMLDDDAYAWHDQAASYAQIVITMNEPKTLPDGLRVMGEIALAQGQCRSAVQLTRQSIRAAQVSKDEFLEGYAWRALACVRLASGKRQTARSALDRAIAIFERMVLAQEVAVTIAIWQLA